MRAQAVAVNVFVIHALGDAISPLMMGAVSERWSLDLAVALMAVPIGMGGLLLLRGARPAPGAPIP